MMGVRFDLFAQQDSLRLSSEVVEFPDSTLEIVERKLPVVDTLSFKADSIKNLSQNLIHLSGDSLRITKEKINETGKKIKNWPAKKLSALDSLRVLSDSLAEKINSALPDINGKMKSNLTDEIPQIDDFKSVEEVQKASEKIESLENKTEGIIPDGFSNVEGENVLEKEIGGVVGEKGSANLPELEKISDLKTKINTDSLTKEKVSTKLEEEVEKRAEEKLESTFPKTELEGDAYFDPSKTNNLQNKSKYFQNKEDVNKEIIERFKALGYDNITSFQDKVKDSQDKLAKYKRKYSNVSSIEDLDKKPANPMKDKTLRERLVWGGNFQVHRKTPYGLDVSPQVSYKFTRIISAGIGGTYRLILNADKNGISSKENVYGSRSFIDFDVFKGFALHGEYEQMRMAAPRTSSVPVTDRSQSRTWIRNGLVGIKKSYSISKRLLGNAQILYNLLPDQKIISPQRIVFRVGFDIVPSEKDKKDKE